MNYSTVAWPSPELLLKHVRSNDYETREHALRLLDVPATTAADDPPEESELRYAELGENGTRQAIIGVRRDPMLYGAVATQVGAHWRRIAAFSCWCKYEYGDLLGNFIRVDSSPDAGQELILRASGGGTGFYEQHEAHFRIHHGQLRLVFTFVSHRRECDPTKPFCEAEWRWFYADSWDSVSGAVLVESRMKVFPETDPEQQFTSIRELELAHARKLSCQTYKWNEEKFRYEPFIAADPCSPEIGAK